MKRLLVIQHLVHDHLHELAGPVADAGFEIVTWCTWLEEKPPVSIDEIDAIISMGGDDSAYADLPYIHNERELLAAALEREVPIFGVCFGAQILAIAAGGRGFKADQHEIGWTRVEYNPEAREDRIGRFLVGSPDVFQYHYDTFSLPPEAVLLGSTDGMVQAYRLGDRAWGVQFHLEATPGLIYGWLGSYADELREAGVDDGEVQADTRRYWATYRRVAWDVASEFCRVALA